MTSTLTPQALPAGTLDTSRRADIISGLNANLANLIDLAAAAKQAHWNVRGPNFQQLHELFDTVADEVHGYGDLLAERAVTLGGLAHGTVQDAASTTSLPAFPTDAQAWAPLTEALRDRMVGAAEQLRAAAATLDDEAATQDMYVEIVRGLEKSAWMLDAHLE